MNPFLKSTLALAALLALTYPAMGQGLPLPPKVRIGTDVYTGDSGYYRKQFGATESVLRVDIGAFSLTSNLGSMERPIITPAHYEPSDWVEGYTIDEVGHWLDDVVGGVWIVDLEEVNVPGHFASQVWVGPEYGPEELVWNPNNATLIESGIYYGFSFQATGSTIITPADTAGQAWATVPQFQIPAVRVNGKLMHFAASDTAVGYDYFGGIGGEYLWITGNSYGGYVDEYGAFGGTRIDGYFSPQGLSPVVSPRNGDGTLLAIGSPVLGPPLIWSDRSIFRFVTKTPTFEVYLSNQNQFVFLSPPTENQPADQVNVDVALLGSFNNNTASFQVTTPQFNPVQAFAGDYNGAPLPSQAPSWGPPAIRITNATWNYRGSTAVADYYGGGISGQVLTIDAAGAVFYTDRQLNFLAVPGYYAGGVFQNLPVVARGVLPDGGALSLNISGNYPPAITVGGLAWYYSAAFSGPDAPAYVGPQSGQILTIVGNNAYLSDPTTGTYRTGTFDGTRFTFTGSTVSVKRAEADGTPIDPAASSNYIAGDLDVSGNTFTLGTWGNGNPSMNAFTLSFSPTSRFLQFEAVEPGTDWLWRTGNAERLRITSGGKIVIGTPVTPDPSVKLHVNGDARFEGVIRTKRAGDISMGQFENGPMP